MLHLELCEAFYLNYALSWDRVRLVIVGGCRGKEDWKMVQDLKVLTKYFSVEDNVEFHPNLPFSDLLAEFSKSTIGIHTMWNEHFGIGGAFNNKNYLPLYCLRYCRDDGS